VQIGAIVTLPERRNIAGGFSEPISGRFREDFLSGSSRMTVDVLGQSLLDRTVNRMRELSHVYIIVIPERLTTASPAFSPFASTAGGFDTALEKAISHQLLRGIDLLLLIRMSAYTDLNFRELLQFHAKTHSLFTRVYGDKGALDIALVDAALLRNHRDRHRTTHSDDTPPEERFVYRGYVNLLNHPHDFRKLVKDGLRGRCGLHPVGTEVRAQVWLGPGAEVDSSAVIRGPAFVGAGSRISAFCTVVGVTAIEHGCAIDCGSFVSESCILQNTYVSIGLDVRRSIVLHNRLFHLDRNVEVACDARLIGPIAKARAGLKIKGHFSGINRIAVHVSGFFARPPGAKRRARPQLSCP
jgi:NDP-sugar pyrophosphorylase family protein